MLWKVDGYMGAIRSVLEKKQMWERTVVVYTSDNGGTVAGNNFPLRSEKCTNFEGGIRVAAFVSGGMVPNSLRGTRSGLRVHIADWYPTFCSLAGVSPADDPPIKPLPVDPQHPSRDIYQGNRSWPGVDGLDVWSVLTHGASMEHAPTVAAEVFNAQRMLVVSAEVVLWGPWKLLLAPTGDSYSGPLFHTGWQSRNGTWMFPPDMKYILIPCCEWHCELLVCLENYCGCVAEFFHCDVCHMY
eukprot:m.378031 g.378031  ORF g.378031 m.378031 type:complete len:242 (+) comp20928_c0_seq16:447-1172(+)